MPDLGGRPFGALTDSQSIDIHQAVLEGRPKRTLAKEYGVSRGSIARALIRVREGDFHIPENYPPLDPYTEASCRTEDPRFFEFDPDEYPERSTLQWAEQIDYAIDVCAGCPLMVQCGADALPAERMWTVRGGELPLAYTAQQVIYAA